ncbi:MAG: hypothetical protein ACI8W8_000996 [Rhodothermales bacterium]|jgi:hypothetical protein
MNTPVSILLALLLFGFAMSARAAADDDSALAALQAEVKESFKAGGRVDGFIKKYCANCHGHKKAKAKLNFQRSIKRPGNVLSHKHLKMAVSFVESLDMPPDDEDKQPSDEERLQFVQWIDQIKYLSPKSPGPFVIRRLSKVEYGNTLHDLYGVDHAIVNELPDEVMGEGFLNSLSPLQSELYLSIANSVLDQILAADGEPPTDIQNRLFGDGRSVKELAASLARDAYRRPPTDAEVAVLLTVYNLAHEAKHPHSAGLRLMLKAILVSPQFLFITPARDVDAAEKIVPLDDYQLASRLSYFLWSTMPDATLFALANSGTLHQPAILRAQVKRMLQDVRALALFDGFGGQWLGLTDLRTKTFDAKKFPLMTAEMREAMVNEVRFYFQSIVKENETVLRFVDSDYSFLNGQLATLYGLEDTVTGPEMRRVTLTNPNRGGILGMPGVLATTSFPNRTSPVKRGVWVLEQVLGKHVPPAPANVPALEKQNKKAVASLTLRERTELHQSKPSCANCHRILDPIGFGLENFDAIGRWREQDDSGGAIDAAGKLPSGEAFQTPAELKAIIASREDDLARNLTKRLLAHALNRQLKGYDEVVAEKLMETIAKDDYRMQTLITEIVTSYPFTHRRVRESTDTDHEK